VEVPLTDLPLLIDGTNAAAVEPDRLAVAGKLVLCRCGDKCVLLLPPSSDALVNGSPVPAGIRVLAHLDSIDVNGASWRFSAEDPPQIVPFLAGTSPDVCPRCRQRIAPGAAAVRCACGNWFHQTAELPCFDYAAACPVCQRATELGTPVPFDPED